MTLAPGGSRPPSPEGAPEAPPGQGGAHGPLRIAGLLLVGLAGLGLTVLGVRAGLAILHPYPFDYGEGAAVVLSAWMHQGNPLYQAPDRPPFLISPYAPLYLWLASLPMSGWPAMAGGRALTLAATLGIALLLGRASWRQAPPGRRALCLGACLTTFLVHPLVLGWSAYYRVDMLGLLFTCAGLLAAAPPRPPGAAGDPPAHPGVAGDPQAHPGAAGDPPAHPGVAGVCMALAFFCKQSFVAGPLAVGITLGLGLPRRGPGPLLRFLAGFGLPVLAGLGGLTALHGGVVIDQFFRFNAMPYHPEQALELALNELPTLLPALLLALAGLGRAGPLWPLYLGASALMAAGSGRFGAYYNYFLELHLALAMLGALSLARSPRAGLRMLAILALAQGLAGGVSRLPFGSASPYFHAPWDHLRHETALALTGRTPAHLTRSLEAGHRLRGWLDLHPGPILAENLGFPAALGRLPWLVDPATFFQLGALGLWDAQPLFERIRRQEFSLILLQRLERNPRFPPAVLQLILQHYELAGETGVDLVLVPRGPVSP